MLELLARTSKWLRLSYEELIPFLKDAFVVGTYQTGISIGGAKYWTWVFVIRDSKSQKVLKGVLGKSFDKVPVCDGLKFHDNFAKKSGSKVHLLKEAKAS